MILYCSDSGKLGQIRRYRLTVRTEPSQGLNTGSIPVSATNSFIINYLINSRTGLRRSPSGHKPRTGLDSTSNSRRTTSKLENSLCAESDPAGSTVIPRSTQLSVAVERLLTAVAERNGKDCQRYARQRAGESRPYCDDSAA